MPGDYKHVEYRAQKAHEWAIVLILVYMISHLMGFDLKRVKGKVVLNQAILGHELTHLLNFKNPDIANPDKLDDIGA